MMSLDQWKKTRRVDHLDLYIAHPRLLWRRGPFHPSVPFDLKVFDEDVAAAAALQTNFDKVCILGRIIVQTAAYLLLTPNPPQRYRKAVQALQQSAQADMNDIASGPKYQQARTRDITNLARGTALAEKHVSLNVFYLAPVGADIALADIDFKIDSHIDNANAANGYKQAKIHFERTNTSATVASQTEAGPFLYNEKFYDQGNEAKRLITYCNASGGAANSIDVVYLSHYDQEPEVEGKTYRSDTYYGGGWQKATRPIVTVTLSGTRETYRTTLAHELGHALTGEGKHSKDPDNLMAGTRNGTNNLTHGQIGWFRNNPYTT